MQALILAGGRGMRLSPLTDNLPKSLLYLPGGTILDYLLYHLSQVPLSATAIVLQYRGDQIARHLSDRPQIVLIPQYAPFTLMGALSSAVPWVEEPTLVLHGNFFFSRPLHQALAQSDPGEPTFFVPPEQAARGRVDGCGAYLLPPRLFYRAAHLVEGNRLDLLYNALVEAGERPVLFPLPDGARCIQTPSDLLAVNRYLLTHWHEVAHPREAGTGYDAMNFNWISPEAEVDESVHGLFMTIGPRARVERSHLFNTLLLPDVRLEGAREQNAVLARTSEGMVRYYELESGMAFPM